MVTENALSTLEQIWLYTGDNPEIISTGIFIINGVNRREILENCTENPRNPFNK